MSNYRRVAFLLVVGLGLLGLTTAPAQEAVVGSWSGTLKAGGMEVRIVFHVEGGEKGLPATMDSPDQGATGIPVSRVTVTGDSVTLAVDRIGGVYTGALADGDTKIDGQWTQGGQSFPLTLTPTAEADTGPPPRPQHPEPPYPYVADSVTFRNEAAGLGLAGTLTRPEGEGPHPAVVLVSGSGPQDRNSEVANHRLFHVLADHLTRQGIAVLRYDERGVGASEGTFEGATSEDFSGDAAAAVRFLRSHSDVDPGAVGLVGMSEGGLVAPMVHTRFEPVDFLVLMAGPSVPGHKILVEQTARIAAAQGAPSGAVDSIRAVQRRTLEGVATAADSAAAAGHLRTVLEDEGVGADRVRSQIEQATDPWFRFFVRYDPTPALRQVDVPVLALYGSKDLQVPPEQNASPMREALQQSPSDDVTVRVLEGGNHLFQPAETGLPNEYAQIETTMAPRALKGVSSWIQERTRTN
ncbi:alpha/beta hydrolase family protein [Salinibacter sp.]|uniref:alpha/beta hydrolase family protein n=1 Tax=Salinibacter sp. TaxID=2065818 RepID=UPI0021E75DEC|nr:alpha/beta hydrolase [Salinibacter sp.]